ncbi:MAG: outer membrane lipoprotein-sorting protein [Pseudomonadota bacterium]|nr:outer membrane lipoprotein-sorting protein [Pseudomonadota bacterium]
MTKVGLSSSGAQRLLLGIGLALLMTPMAQAKTMEEVTACMRSNIPKSVQIKEFELTATDRSGGIRELRGRLYGVREEQDKLRAMMKISAPTDMAGAAYLLREKEGGDEKYIYVPALNKVRRVTGADAEGTLWGTDISYSDLRQLNNAFTEGQSTLEGEGDLAGRKVYIVRVKPDAGAGHSRFSEVKLWVDQQTCVGLRAEFTEGTTVRKRFDVDPKSLRQAGKVWYAGEALMSDLGLGSKTRIRVVGLSSDVTLSGRYFNPSTFYVGG